MQVIFPGVVFVGGGGVKLLQRGGSLQCLLHPVVPKWNLHWLGLRRRNRWILAVGAAGVVLPIIIAMAFNLNGSSGFICPFFLSCVFSQMTVALLGANAVAEECSDRSDESMRGLSTFASKQFFPVITVVAVRIVYLWGGDQVAL